MECPNDECKKNVDGMRRTLFGDDGLHGLTACVKGMVPKKWLWVGLVVVGIPLLVTGIKVWSGQESAHLRYALRSDHNVLKGRMDVTDERYRHICEALQRMEKIQGQIQAELKRLRDP